MQARPAHALPGCFLPAKQQVVENRPSKLIPASNLWQDKLSCHQESS
jgi:hypothetical protein